MTGLVGNSNEADIEVEGVATSALLDTGVSVSTVSEQFYRSHLQHVELQRVDQLVKIECANGESLPYLGYIQVDVAVPGVGRNLTQPCMMLVVPITQYSSSTPVLLGTNFLSTLLSHCNEQLGARLLQKISNQVWYLALRCVALCERHLQKQGNRVAVVRCAEPAHLTVGPNQKTTVRGYIDRAEPYHVTCALLQSHHQANQDLDIEPALITYTPGSRQQVEVTISNVSTQTVTVNPKAILCEVQPCTITSLDDVPTEIQDDVMAQVDIDSKHLSTEQLSIIKDLVGGWRHIFSLNEEDVGLYGSVKHRIDLHDTVPFKQWHRMIPPSMLDEVRSHHQQLLAAGVIRRSHSPWSSNIVLARRKDGRLRLCTDFRQLNECTIKDSYALPRVEEILDCLSGSEFFTVLDMKSGYYQVEIEEVHKQRIAFTVGPLGFF
jgi:hypothetical protein